MSIREIPKSYEYKCDACGATHIQENASGHYGNSTPENWMTVKISRYNKVTEEFLLCNTCELKIAEVLREGLTLTI